MYFMQQWFNLSDPAMEDALYDSEAMRRFARIDPGVDVVPGESTILRFRHLLEQHKLTERIFQEVRQFLEERKLLDPFLHSSPETVQDSPSPAGLATHRVGQGRTRVS